MSLDEIAESMRRRMPWSVGKLVLQDNNIARGQGWENTVEKLVNDGTASVEDEQHLISSLKDHLFCGEKFIKLYRVNQSSRNEIINRFLATDIDESIAASKFPLLLTEDEVASESAAMKLIAIEEQESGLNVAFSSIRTTTIRRKIEDQELSEAAREDLQEFEEIIGVKNVRSQAIDVVYIPRDENHIDLRADFPKGGLIEQAQYANQVLESRIQQICGENLLGQAQNLFPLIEHMYNSPTEGKIVELEFGTTTRSLKHERMRRGAIDLRQEMYHQGGKAALETAIEPHKISIEYNRPVGDQLVSRPELTLASTYRMSLSTTPVLSAAIVRRCANVEDYLFIRRRLRHFLRRNAPDGA